LPTEGLEATPTGPVSTESVPAGGTFSASWQLHVPADAQPGTMATVEAAARWTSGGVTDKTSAHTSLLVGGPVGPPYRTVASTDAVFAQSDDDVSIAAGGEDLWGDTSEYAAVYEDDALDDGAGVVTEVVRQDASSAYSRAGLIVANDLAAADPHGFANIAVTPDHGCMFSWDSDADGRLDTYERLDGFSPDVHVRIAKDGDRLTGSCSSDGKNWAVVGTGTVPDAAAGQDVGMFVSAVNRHTDEEAIATFHGGIADAPSSARDSSGDTLQSLRKPITALNEEPGHPATAANDGSRANNPYWGGPLSLGSTWWQVDLGTVDDVSRVNVRNYVDGSRYYT
jgi:hypothetical protein